MRFRPMRGSVLAVEVELPETSAGGIIYANITREKGIMIRKAKVLEVGPPRVTERGIEVPSVLKPGDTVYFINNRVQEVEGLPYEGRTLVIDEEKALGYETGDEA